MQFQRSLGPLGLTFAAVGGMLGSSWLFAPYYVAQAAGPAAVLAWVIGALVTLVIAMAFAELTCMFPVSGSSARFIYFSHGIFASFIFGWIMWLSYTSVAPIETLAVLQYIASHYPNWLLMEQKEGIAVLTLKGYGVASFILFIICALNFLSIRWLVRYNTLIVLVKIALPLFIVLALFLVSFHPENFYATPGGYIPYGLEGLATSISLAGVIFAYAGYAPAIILAGETKNPERVVPMVLIASVLICMVIYVLIQIAFIGSHDSTVLTEGWRHLRFTQDMSPILGVAREAGLDHLSSLILFSAILSPLGTALIFIATSSRVSFAMTQNGYFPQALLFLNQKGVPILAVLVNFVVGMLLFLPAPGWQSMVGFLVASFAICSVIAPISLVALRSQFPQQARPFKLPFYLAWCALALFFSNLIIYWSGWDVFYHLSIAMLLGLTILGVVRHFNPVITAKMPLEWANGLWVIVYFLAIGVIIYFGQSASSKHLIPKGLDILCIAVLSILILALSWYRRLPEDIAAKRIEKVLKQHGILTPIIQTYGE